VKIVNSILWNEGTELQGDGFDVSFSCVRGGFVGEGNISSDPLFVNVENPRGRDETWGSLDDGLRLRNNSPVINKGKNADVSYDFAFRNRPMQGGFDMGVFETIITNENELISLGFLRASNEFIQEWTPIIQHGHTPEELRIYRRSRGAVTIRLLVERNQHTQNTREGYGYFNFIDEYGNNLPSVRIRFFRNGETSSHFIFTSQVAQNGVFTGGKPILLVLEPELASSTNPDFYLVPASLNGRMNIHIPFNQNFARF
jgi:hypothetical protein